MAGLLLSGNVTFDRFISGAATDAYYGPINATALAINPGQADRKTRKSYGRDTYGQSLDSVILPGSPSIKITINDASPEVLAFALLGDVSVVSQTGGAVTDEVVTVSTLDRWHKLTKHAVSAVTVTNSAGTTTYVLDDDYTLDLESGMIKPLSTGDIAAGGIKVSYTAAATTARRVTGSQQSDITARIRLDGTNLATGKACRLVAYKAVMAPSGELGLLADDFISFDLEGDLVTPSGYTSAYYYEEAV